MTRYFLPRPIHPYAWWIWAIATAVTAGMTTNPLLLLAIIAVVCLVVYSRRGDNPWAKAFGLYLILGASIVIIRILFRVLLGGGDGPTILFRLPEIQLPWWVGGIRLLGPVSLEAILTGASDGLRLAAIIIALGAANSLANPKRLLGSLPGAMYELGTVLVVSLSVFPQLGDSIMRVSRARKLRRARAAGNSRRDRMRIVETIIIPVLSDALERSLHLAASMDVRGYGRHGTAASAQKRLTTGFGLLALVLLGTWSYLLLATNVPGPNLFGLPVVPSLLLLAGVASAIVALRMAGATVNRTQYRPIRWAMAESVVALSGLALVATVWAIDRSNQIATLFPSTNPIEWPTLTPMMLLGLTFGAVPAFFTPRPRLADQPALEIGEAA